MVVFESFFKDKKNSLFRMILNKEFAKIIKKFICNFVFMSGVLFFLVLFVVFVGGGWSLARGFANFLFPKEEERFVDKSINNHYHTHIHEHRNISIIDEETKEKILDLKDSKTKKPPQ